jgi:hypothetical protein
LAKEKFSLAKMRVSLKTLICIGTGFMESGNLCRVTRVTDTMFDTLDTVTGKVKVRNLRAWETGQFVNSISGVTGLLRIREQLDEIAKLKYLSRAE